MTDHLFSNPKFHGITSLSLIAAAALIAIISLSLISPALGCLYIIVCAFSSGTIVYAYCSKCPCKNHCMHVFPGKLASKIKHRPSKKYTLTEIFFLILALLLLFGLPQYWLSQFPLMFTVFWVFSIIAIIQIRLYVCRACSNVFCPLNRTQKNNDSK